MTHDDPRVQLREIPAHRMAAVRFSGLATQGNVKEQTEDRKSVV